MFVGKSTTSPTSLPYGALLKFAFYHFGVVRSGEQSNQYLILLTKHQAKSLTQQRRVSLLLMAILMTLTTKKMLLA